MNFFFGFTSLLWINKKRHTSKPATISDECRFWTWWTGCVEHPAGIQNWLTPSPAILTPKITLEVMRKSILSLMDSGWDANIQPICPTVVKVITDGQRWPRVLLTFTSNVKPHSTTAWGNQSFLMRVEPRSCFWSDICPGSPVLQPFHPFPHS